MQADEGDGPHAGSSHVHFGWMPKARSGTAPEDGPILLKWLVILSLVIAAGIAVYAVVGPHSLISSIRYLPGQTIGSLLVLLIGNEIVKGLRWAFFLRAADLNIRVVDGLTSYLAAQAASALPGGSALAARMAEEHGRIRMRQAASGLVGEYIADTFALALVAAAAILYLHQPAIQLLIPAVTVFTGLGVIAVIRDQRLAQWVMGMLDRWERTRRIIPKEEDFRRRTISLMRWRVIAIATLYSLLTTLLSAAILFTIVDSFSRRAVQPAEAMYVHSFSTIARMAFPVPGGYAVGDVSLAGLLHIVGVGLTGAAFIALVYRTAGTLFRTGFGFLVLVLRYPHLLVGSLHPRRLRASTRPLPTLTEPVIATHDTAGGSRPGTVLMATEPPPEPGDR